MQWLELAFTSCSILRSHDMSSGCSGICITTSPPPIYGCSTTASPLILSCSHQYSNEFGVSTWHLFIAINLFIHLQASYKRMSISLLLHNEQLYNPGVVGRPFCTLMFWLVFYSSTIGLYGMYIPLSLPHLHGSVADTQDHGSLQTTLLAFQALMKLLCSSCSRTGQYPTGNIKRQFSDNPSKNNDIKIGLIVGFTLAAFLAIVITFLYFYYGSARFTFRKKKKNHRHQHHHHPHHPPRHRRHKSLSSGGSGLSNNSAPPPAPPADDAPPKDKPADG